MTPPQISCTLLFHWIHWTKKFWKFFARKFSKFSKIFKFFVRNLGPRIAAFWEVLSTCLCVHSTQYTILHNSFWAFFKKIIFGRYSAFCFKTEKTRFWRKKRRKLLIFSFINVLIKKEKFWRMPKIFYASGLPLDILYAKKFKIIFWAMQWLFLLPQKFKW